MKPWAFLLLATAALGPVQAQLRTPNEAGIAWGHWHFNATDVDAQMAFWKTLGGVPVQNGQLKMISFPGMLILMRSFGRAIDMILAVVGNTVADHCGIG